MPSGPVIAIANRGEIAIRIARTVRQRGWQPVALLGEPDLNSFAAREVGRVEAIGPAGSELDPQRVVAAAVRAEADALHPGYGFLSERPELSRACQTSGIVFVGPTPHTLALCGDKIATREIASRTGVPVLQASDPLSVDDESRWHAAAGQIGYPIIAKIAGGGGGRGLRVAMRREDLRAAVLSAIREAGASGAGERLYLEHYLVGARHVEVQVAGNGADAVALGDRDCSIQRRHQKVIEEAPAPGLSDDLRATLHSHAVRLAKGVALSGVATVEFLVSRDGEIAFLEINPRLQVEHTVTEEVTGLDLVDVQLSLAFGGPLPRHSEPSGHAIQARLYAEDPLNAFAPSPGIIRTLDWPRMPRLRVDSGYQAGDTIPDAYDSMIAKIIVTGRTRDVAVRRLLEACVETRIAGVATNRPWLVHLLRSSPFIHAHHDLTTAESFALPDDARVPDSLVQVATHMLPKEAAGSVWHAAGPFRLIGNASQVFHGDDGDGWERTLWFHPSTSGWAATVDAGSIPVDADSSSVVVLPHGDGYELSGPEGRWIVRVGARPRQASESEHLDGAVRSPMPGTVVAVNVALGEAVQAGDVLIVMTAMKIEIALAAPFPGVVTSLDCAPGDLVGSRQPLATVTRTDGEESSRECD